METDEPQRPRPALRDPDPHAWIEDEEITTSDDVELPELLLDEVIGQDEAVEVARKAAKQGRNLLLLGDPGTGKSMIAKAMAEILPKRRLDDVLVHPNPKDENLPRIQVTEGGTGRQTYREAMAKSKRRQWVYTATEWIIAVSLLGVGVWAFWSFGGTSGLIVGILALLVALFFLYLMRQSRPSAEDVVPNLIIEHPEEPVPAPFVAGTGSHAGALLGDVRHDPFQSGGLETPVHLRVEPGAIHRAHKGLLFIDEINALRVKSQQALLTAMQDEEYAITGQSERSAGAMARTDPVPCDFILVAAGNMDVLEPATPLKPGLHPALRSRIRGYGYEVYVRNIMEDTDENRAKLVRFVAQEVRRDGTIPPFSKGAIAEVIREAQRRSGHTGKLTLRLRELGGLVRTAGDLARYEDRDLVTVDDVLRAKDASTSLEYQVTRRSLDVKTSKRAQAGQGSEVGICAGAAVVGTGETGEPAGVVVPVEADALQPMDPARGTIVLGGGLEGSDSITNNLSAALKRLKAEQMSSLDIHVQALLPERSAQVRSLGAAAAVAAISGLQDRPVPRDVCVLGALSVNGRLDPVDGITQMIEGAADLGYTRVIVPAANQGDVLLAHSYRDQVEVAYAASLDEVLEQVLEAEVHPVEGANGSEARP